MAKAKPSFLQQEKIREAIRTTQLVKRLEFFALEENDPAAPDTKIELDANRLRAIDMLLKKSLPDLSSITIEGGANPIKTQEVGEASAKLAGVISAIASRTTGEPS